MNDLVLHVKFSGLDPLGSREAWKVLGREHGTIRSMVWKDASGTAVLEQDLAHSRCSDISQSAHTVRTRHGSAGGF